MESVQVILPCLNEAAALPTVLASVPPDYQALVVDNCSVDATARVAGEHGATVIGCAARGYGAACHAGLLAATAEVVVWMDADGSLDGRQLSRVVEPVSSGRADLMIGTRRPVSSAAWPWWLQAANAELARELSVRTGQRIRDLGAMRAGRREQLLCLDLRDRRSGYPAETLVAAADAGWRIGQVEVDYRPRIGRSKVTGTPLGALRAVRDLRAVMAAR
jgi:glycosyltransferase involved in cell wall biosynthesis